MACQRDWLHIDSTGDMSLVRCLCTLAKQRRACQLASILFWLRPLCIPFHVQKLKGRIGIDKVPLPRTHTLKRFHMPANGKFLILDHPTSETE